MAGKFEFRKVTPAGASAQAATAATQVVENVPAAAKVISPETLAAAAAANKLPETVQQAPQPAPATPAPVAAETSKAVTVQQAPQPPAVQHRGPATYEDDAENIRAKDVRLPRINIVQKVGDLSNIFTPGDIVLNQATVIFKAPKQDPVTKGWTQNSKPLQIVVVGFRPDRYTEKVEGGALGNLVDTEAEVFEAGGTCDYNEAEATGKPLYQTLAEAMVFIAKPDDVDDPTFAYVADGKRWAACLWSMKGGQYTNGAKIFRTARKSGWLASEVNPLTKEMIKERKYFHGVWSFATALKAYRTGNWAWIPNVRKDSETGPEIRALAESIL